MKYQLVLQWPASSFKSYDALVEVEDTLIEKLSAANDVDGHDGGSGEVNVFINTDDPTRTFHEVESILRAHDFWASVRIAYRSITGSDYIVLWPKGLNEFKIT